MAVLTSHRYLQKFRGITRGIAASTADTSSLPYAYHRKSPSTYHKNSPQSILPFARRKFIVSPIRGVWNDSPENSEIV